MWGFGEGKPHDGLSRLWISEYDNRDDREDEQNEDEKVGKREHSSAAPRSCSRDQVVTAHAVRSHTGNIAQNVVTGGLISYAGPSG